MSSFLSFSLFSIFFPFPSFPRAVGSSCCDADSFLLGIGGSWRDFRVQLIRAGASQVERRSRLLNWRWQKSWSGNQEPMQKLELQSKKFDMPRPLASGRVAQARAWRTSSLACPVLAQYTTLHTTLTTNYTTHYTVQYLLCTHSRIAPISRGIIQCNCMDMRQGGRRRSP